VVHVDHLKELKVDGVSENQYISDSDQSVEAESEYESDTNSDKERNSEDARQEYPHSQPSSLKQSRKGRLLKPVSRYSP
jgi:hypothetical protein